MASVLSAPHFHNETAAYAYVEAHLWPQGSVCPHCGATAEHIGALKGKSTRIGVRKCYACRKPFTVKVGTIFEASHIPLHIWLQAIHLICSSKKGISSHQLQRTLGTTIKTAWFLGHRIREAMKRGGPVTADDRLGGIDLYVEADETYLGRKEGMKKAKAGAGHKVAVMALVERNGEVRSFHVPNVRAETLRTIVADHVSRDTHFRTDDSRIYTEIGWNFKSHETVKHSEEEYVRGDAYTNTIEGYFSILKRGIYGVFQHVSEAHLHRYLAEFDFRYSNRIAVGIDDVARASIALKGAQGKRLTYRTTGGRRAKKAAEERRTAAGG